MHATSIAPKLLVSATCLRARTPWVARAIWLFSFDRQVSVDRALRRVTIATRRIWIWRNRRVVPFERINRIVLRAQTFPGFAFLSAISFGFLPGADAALFMISLGLTGGSEEVNLFTVVEDESDDSDWLDALTSDKPTEPRLGDEGTSEIVNHLRDFLGVPVASR
jgi:hypothetical protein